MADTEPTYTCNTCDFVCISQDILDHHLQTVHHSNSCGNTPDNEILRKPLLCQKCCFACYEDKDLKEHYAIIHKGDNSETTVSSEPNRHDVAKPLLCKQCGFAFYEEKDLEEHCKNLHQKNNRESMKIMEAIRSSENRDKKPLLCLECTFACGTYEDLKEHYQNSHKDNPNIRMPLQNSPLHDQDKNPLRCLECSFTCFERAELREHYQNAHRKNSFANSILSNLLTTEMNTSFQCQRCSFVCLDSKTLEEHYRNMHGIQKDGPFSHHRISQILNRVPENFFPCRFCEQIFPGVREFQEHLETVHQIRSESYGVPAKPITSIMKPISNTVSRQPSSIRPFHSPLVTYPIGHTRITSQDSTTITGQLSVRNNEMGASSSSSSTTAPLEQPGSRSSSPSHFHMSKVKRYIKEVICLPPSIQESSIPIPRKHTRLELANMGLINKVSILSNWDEKRVQEELSSLFGKAFGLQPGELLEFVYLSTRPGSKRLSAAPRPPSLTGEDVMSMAGQGFLYVMAKKRLSNYNQTEALNLSGDTRDLTGSGESIISRSIHNPDIQPYSLLSSDFNPPPLNVKTETHVKSEEIFDLLKEEDAMSSLPFTGSALRSPRRSTDEQASASHGTSSCLENNQDLNSSSTVEKFENMTPVPVMKPSWFARGRKRFMSNKEKMFVKDIMCLPPMDKDINIPIPRGQGRQRLISMGLIGKLCIFSEWDERRLQEEITSVFRNIFDLPLGDMLDFSYLGTVSGCKKLCKPTKPPNEEWNAKEVVALAGQGCLYIMAKQFPARLMEAVKQEEDDGESEEDSVKSESSSGPSTTRTRAANEMPPGASYTPTRPTCASTSLSAQVSDKQQGRPMSIQKNFSPLKKKIYIRDVICLPSSPNDCNIPIPRQRTRLTLANLGLMGKIYLSSDWTERQIREDISSTFSKVFQLRPGELLDYIYLSTPPGSRKLSRPSTPASGSWNGEEVLKLIVHGSLFIMAGKHVFGRASTHVQPSFMLEYEDEESEDDDISLNSSMKNGIPMNLSLHSGKQAEILETYSDLRLGVVYVVCLPSSEDETDIPIPSPLLQHRLQKTGLSKKIHIRHEWDDKKIQEEITMNFKEVFHLTDKQLLEFIYLSSSMDSKVLSRCNLPGNEKWTGSKVLKLTVQGNLYIMIKSFFTIFKNCNKKDLMDIEDYYEEYEESSSDERSFMEKNFIGKPDFSAVHTSDSELVNGDHKLLGNNLRYKRKIFCLPPRNFDVNIPIPRKIIRKRISEAGLGKTLYISSNWSEKKVQEEISRAFSEVFGLKSGELLDYIYLFSSSGNKRLSRAEVPPSGHWSGKSVLSLSLNKDQLFIMAKQLSASLKSSNLLEILELGEEHDDDLPTEKMSHCLLKYKRKVICLPPQSCETNLHIPQTSVLERIAELNLIQSVTLATSWDEAKVKEEISSAFKEVFELKPGEFLNYIYLGTFASTKRLCKAPPPPNNCWTGTEVLALSVSKESMFIMARQLPPKITKDQIVDVTSLSDDDENDGGVTDDGMPNNSKIPSDSMVFHCKRKILCLPPQFSSNISLPRKAVRRKISELGLSRLVSISSSWSEKELQKEISCAFRETFNLTPLETLDYIYLSTFAGTKRLCKVPSPPSGFWTAKEVLKLSVNKEYLFIMVSHLPQTLTNSPFKDLLKSCDDDGELSDDALPASRRNLDDSLNHSLDCKRKIICLPPQNLDGNLPVPSSAVCKEIFEIGLGSTIQVSSGWNERRVQEEVSSAFSEVFGLKPGQLLDYIYLSINVGNNHLRKAVLPPSGCWTGKEIMQLSSNKDCIFIMAKNLPLAFKDFSIQDSGIEDDHLIRPPVTNHVTSMERYSYKHPKHSDGSTSLQDSNCRLPQSSSRCISNHVRHCKRRIVCLPPNLFPDTNIPIPRKRVRQKMLEIGLGRKFSIVSTWDELRIKQEVSSAFSGIFGLKPGEFLNFDYLSTNVSTNSLFKAPIPSSGSWTGKEVLALTKDCLYILAKQQPVGLPNLQEVLTLDTGPDEDDDNEGMSEDISDRLSGASVTPEKSHSQSLHSHSHKAKIRKIICLLQIANESSITIPRKKCRQKLLQLGLIQSLNVQSDWDADTVQQEISRVFGKIFNLRQGEKLPFYYMRTGESSKKLKVLENNERFDGKSVRALVVNHSLYIMARKFPEGFQEKQETFSFSTGEEDESDDELSEDPTEIEMHHGSFGDSQVKNSSVHPKKAAVEVTSPTALSPNLNNQKSSPLKEKFKFASDIVQNQLITTDDKEGQVGKAGQTSKDEITKERLEEMLRLHMTVWDMAVHLGISCGVLQKKMKEFQLRGIQEKFSSVTDTDLRPEIKKDMPSLGEISTREPIRNKGITMPLSRLRAAAAALKTVEHRDDYSNQS